MDRAAMNDFLREHHDHPMRDKKKLNVAKTDFEGPAAQVPCHPRYDSENMAVRIATYEEAVKCHEFTSEDWAGRLTQDQYMEREHYLQQGPMASPERHDTWILTWRDRQPNKRPIFGSCETFEKPAWIAWNDKITKVTAYATTAVFSQKQYTGRRYSNRLAGDIYESLKAEKHRQEKDKERDIAFNVIWSSISGDFYQTLDWTPLPSWHHNLTAVSPADYERSIKELGGTPVTDLNRYRVQTLMCSDAAMREHADVLLARSRTENTPQITFVPTIDQMDWHWRREDYATRQLSDEKHGVEDPSLLTAGVYDEESCTVMAWTHYYTATEQEDSLNILRIQYNELEINPQRRPMVVKGITKCLLRAQLEAAKQKIGTVQVWNSDPMVEEAIRLLDPNAKRQTHEKRQVACLKWDGRRLGYGDKVTWCWREFINWC